MTLIEKTIKETGVELGFIDILNSNFLKNCYRTDFCWAHQPNSICLAMSKNYLKMAMHNPNILGVVTTPKIFMKESHNIPKSIVLLTSADQFFYYLHNAKLHNQFDWETIAHSIHPTAQVSDKANISSLVTIGAGVVIHDGAVILGNTIIGRNSIIYQNVTIGTEGFFSKVVLQKKIHIEHFGGVKIGNNCIIHAGSNISRAVHFRNHTTIGSNSHIGIQTNISHDCQIGEHCDISAKVCLSGRVKVGNHVWIGAGAVVSNQVHIYDNAEVKIGSVVIEDVPPNMSVSGNFSVNHKTHLRKYLNRDAHEIV
ncbi:MAG: hypothetical protein A3F18_04070 [Legionellales bacterium RIFCSPHIGHO2_12_FULL_37_14]|nr:MAG: hypothetical protein A3F18_04070 [Legionellales bacterium RIFCSPHIGHO2_12_FULL_37_14]